MPRFPLVALLLFGLLPGTLLGASRAERLLKQEDAWFQSEAGKQAMAAVLSWQSPHGDWPKNQDTTQKVYSGDRAKLRGTFDNGATTGELRLLAHAFRVTADTRYEQAFLKGFDHILDAQYQNGGWPQYFPLRKGYYSRITFNDGSMVRLLEFLTAATTEDAYEFLDADRRAAARDAITRGISCILQCQVIMDGRPTVWCAQHDERTLAPAPARSYELASLSGGESAGILKYLMRIQDPSPEIISAVEHGIAWYETAKIEGVRFARSPEGRKLVPDPSARPLWARFYELETNRPLFCDRDGVPKYSIEEIGAERRNGYAWYGTWGESLAKAYAQWPHRKSATAQREE